MHWLGQALAGATENGDLEMVKCTHQYHPEPLGVSTFEIAVKHGQLEILQWLFQHRYDSLCCQEPPGRYTKGEMACCLNHLIKPVCKAEHLEVLAWLCQGGYVNDADERGDIAAMQGNLELVRWFHERQINRALSSFAVEAAVEGGQLAVVKYLLANGYEGSNLLEIAILKGHDMIATYLRENDIDTTITPTFYEDAARLGRLDLLQSEYEYLGDPDLLRDARDAAVINGRLDVVKWLHPRCTGSFRPDAFQLAAKNGHLPVLQYLHECSVESGWGVMEGAAECGHLEIVKWAHHKLTHQGLLSFDHGCCGSKRSPQRCPVAAYQSNRGVHT